MTTTQKKTLYVGRWNDVEYVYALTFDSAVASVKRHFAYGNSNEDDYAVGDAWASGESDSGWRIAEIEVDVSIIKIEILLSNQDETGHVAWLCPACGESYSDEWTADDKLPVLLMCGCSKQTKFLLGVGKRKGDAAH